MKKIVPALLMLSASLSANAYTVEASATQKAEKTWLFSIDLCNNDVDFTAFQIDVKLDGEADLTEECLGCSELMGNHKLALGTPDSHYRILGYSMQNTNFVQKEGSLLTFTITGDFTSITIDKILFAKADGTEVAADAFSSSVEALPDGIAVPTAVTDDKTQMPIYDLSGKKVYRIDRKGIFIRNGKKTLK